MGRNFGVEAYGVWAGVAICLRYAADALRAAYPRLSGGILYASPYPTGLNPNFGGSHQRGLSGYPAEAKKSLANPFYNAQITATLDLL